MKHLVLICALALPGFAAADRWSPPPMRPADADRHGPARIGMGEAMDRVARATGGRVLQAQPATVNGHEGYRVKILTRSGEVRVVYVDAATGAMQ